MWRSKIWKSLVLGLIIGAQIGPAAAFTLAKQNTPRNGVIEAVDVRHRNVTIGQRQYQLAPTIPEDVLERLESGIEVHYVLSNENSGSIATIWLESPSNQAD